MQSITVGGLFSGVRTVALLLLLFVLFTPAQAQTVIDWGNQRYEAEGKDSVETIITYTSVGDGMITIRKMEINYGGSGNEAIFLIHRKTGKFFIDGNEESILFTEKHNGKIVALILAEPGNDGKNLAESTRYHLTRYDLRRSTPRKAHRLTDRKFPRLRMTDLENSGYDGIRDEVMQKFKLSTIKRVEFKSVPPQN